MAKQEESRIEKSTAFAEALGRLVAEPPPEDPESVLREMARIDHAKCSSLGHALASYVPESMRILKGGGWDSTPQSRLASVLWAVAFREKSERANRPWMPGWALSACWVPIENPDGIHILGATDGPRGMVVTCFEPAQLEESAGRAERFEAQWVASLLEQLAAGISFNSVGPGSPEVKLDARTVFQGLFDRWARSKSAWGSASWRADALGALRSLHEAGELDRESKTQVGRRNKASDARAGGPGGRL